jgi:4-amino-4-deoxy-L-arabinose transferase-like glycosyltransferase
VFRTHSGWPIFDLSATYPKWITALIIAFAYLSFLGTAGIIGPDEARYASIGRAMAESGDWLLPRLNGELWLEKPPLLYWLSGLGFAFGLPDEWAARLGVALFSVLFFAAFYWLVSREFGTSIAELAVLLLAASPFWLGFSFAAVTDVPMSASFVLAVLAAMRGHRLGSGIWFALAGFGLGLAMLGKGLVPVVLFAPVPILLFFFKRSDERGWQLTNWLLCFSVAGALALAWFIPADRLSQGMIWQQLIIKHHWQRFHSPELKHVQPFWFYLPVLLGALLPWTSLMAARRTQPFSRSACLPFLIVIWGMIFFSASLNKLPGYLTPLLPLVALLLAERVVNSGMSRWAGALLFSWIPILIAGVSVLPQALSDGLRDAVSGATVRFLVIGMLTFGCFGWWLVGRIGLPNLTRALAFLILIAIPSVKAYVLPKIDSAISARQWLPHLPQGRLCLERVPRPLRYSLDFYKRQDGEKCAGAVWRAEPQNTPAMGFPKQGASLRQPLDREWRWEKIHP